MGFEKYKFTRLSLTLPWQNGENGDRKKPRKTINIFMGFFFMVNFCLGTGFLGIPYSFFYSGLLAGMPTLILVGFVSWLNANWSVECMARAQALESYEKSQHPPTDSDTTDSEVDIKGEKQVFQALNSSHPKFEITLKRKFELVELCEIFFNRWMKYLYLIITVIYCFLALWSFATVAGSAWAINIPLNFGASCQCDDTAFQHNILPGGGCLFAYYFSVFLFGIIVVTLSLVDLKEQALVQVFLGMLRFITVAAIVIYSIVKLAEGGEVCERQFHQLNTSAHPNVTLADIRFISVRDVVLKFDVRGWLTSIPVFTYAFLLHSGIPAMTHPIKQKGYLHWLTTTMFVTAGVCYFSLGVVVPLWFRASVQETITLNFGIFTAPGNSVQLRIFAYYLILFPSLDVMSAYPLTVHVAFNNLYILITGRDTSKKPRYKYDFLIRLSLRLVCSVLPLLAAFGVANLIYILKYAGLFGFFVCFFFPTALQLRSIIICKRKFASVHFSMSGSHSNNDSIDHKGEISPPPFDKDKSTLLSIQELQGKDKRSLYMTPYSNAVLSHPITVLIVGIIGVLLFMLSIASLFVHVNKVSCLENVTYGSPIEEL